MNNPENQVRLEIDARAENVSLARVVATAFVTPFDPTVGELSDIKTAVSEAVTNAIIHGYGENSGIVAILLTSHERKISIEISDTGIGIENIENVREPLFTTKPEMERSGLGFTVMESFMDSIHVYSNSPSGIIVKMVKELNKEQESVRVVQNAATQRNN